MKVTILTYTKDPADAISFAAGVCYGRRNVSVKRLKTCFSKNHMSVFEQASVQFLIEGISRSCSHQLVRHRLNSYCQESQRYCEIDVNSDDWYVMPPSFNEGAADWFRRKMRSIAKRYKIAIDGGTLRQDARFLLPEACKTNLVVTMNFRNLFHFFDMRLDPDAQWEIRELAREMLEKCMLNPELRGITQLYVEKNNIKFE